MTKRKQLFSLTKLGNLKLGKIKDGNVIAMDKILVTMATKETDENFKIYPGFKAEGYEELNVTLPFNDPDLNFEVNYISFLKINDIEYIAKAEDIGKPIVLHPLNPEDFDKGSKILKELTLDLVEKLGFKYTGFLKVQLPNISSFGEVFYFKTQSINTINALRNQLLLTNTLLDGLANYPLVLKPIKKDVANGKTITYLSIGMNMKQIAEYKENLEHIEDSLNYADLDDLYKDSRYVDFDELEVISEDNVVVLGNKFEETVSIVSEEDEFIKILKEHGVDKDVFEMILKVATKNTIVTIARYYKFLEKNGRTYKSNFKKAIKEGKAPYLMISEMDA